MSDSPSAAEAVSPEVPDAGAGEKAGGKYLGQVLVMILDISVQLTMWGVALALTVILFNAAGLWPGESPFGAHRHVVARWAVVICWAIIMYNLIFILEIVLLRLFIPTPPEGHYPTGEGANKKALFCAMFLGMLTKARYKPPFPGFLVHPMVHLPGIRFLVKRVVGPKSETVFLNDPLIMNPSHIEIGKNVIVGYQAVIAAQHQTHSEVVIGKTIIEDDVLIGGGAGIFGNAHLKKGCMIGVATLILPGTVVGENEFWIGIPGRKAGMIKDGKIIPDAPHQPSSGRPSDAGHSAEKPSP